MKANDRKQTVPRSARTPRRILVPVDFSEPSRKALGAAIALARRFGAELTVAHVTRRPRPDSHPVLELLTTSPDHRRAARKQLNEFVGREVPGDIKAAALVLDGVLPFNEISRAATPARADLIVIATHGYTGLKHALLGSTTERVVRHANCPVLVVRGREARGARTAFAPDQVRTILLTTDFSANSLTAFPQAAAWARELGARLLLLYVVPEHFPAELSQIGLVLQEKAVAAEAVSKLTEIRRAHLPADLAVETRVLIGPVESTICKTAQASGAGLVIMASHGHTGFKRLMLGSAAERVVQRAPCAVLVVRGKGGA